MRRVHGGGAPLVMGVLNVTPDSFSDGGRFVRAADAVAHARTLIDDGADVLDVGGESTRPGAEAVAADVEIARVRPVIEAVRAASDVPISVDTMKPSVACAAIDAGADIWNDVSALRHDPESPRVASTLGCPVVLTHMQGLPKTMQAQPRYDDVVVEVGRFLKARADVARAAGVARDAILVDPGVGFGKTLDHNLELMRALPALAKAVGKPLLFGASRKRFIQAIDDPARDETDRLGGSLAAALWAAAHGARVLRVHDVRETVQALAVWRRIDGRE